jgi:hypothetical protein
MALYDVLHQRGLLQNRQKLKSRFEDIFERYSKDLSDSADIVDLHTMTITRNNGHIAQMANESDPADHDARHFIPKFGHFHKEEDSLKLASLNRLPATEESEKGELWETSDSSDEDELCTVCISKLRNPVLAEEV